MKVEVLACWGDASNLLCIDEVVRLAAMRWLRFGREIALALALAKYAFNGAMIQTHGVMRPSLLGVQANIQLC